MNRKQFNQKIQNEYEEFRKQTSQLTKEEIFEKANEIAFKTYLTMFLQDEESLSDSAIEKFSELEDIILDAIYVNYVENDGDFAVLDICDDAVASYLEILDFEDYE